MTNRTADVSLRKAALVAGFGYLIIFVFGFFAFALESLIVSGDAAMTASKIAASESQFRAGIASSLIVLVADAVVAWALYIYLKPVSKSISLLTAWLRLIYVAVAASAFVGLFSLSMILRDATVSELGQLDTLTALFLNVYQYGFNVGFVFFGLHILGLGYLIWKSDYVPRVLGVLLIIAALGYQIDSFASLVSSSYANNDVLFLVFVAVPAIVSELALTLWLLTRGRNVVPTGKPSIDSV
jgi:hypothetical protein